MSAFGKRGPTGGPRPSFGVARPMQGGGPPTPPTVEGGDQFPPLDTLDIDGEPESAGSAMSRLQDRIDTAIEANAPKEGFEASVHKIKEQVLPRPA